MDFSPPKKIPPQPLCQGPSLWHMPCLRKLPPRHGACCDGGFWHPDLRKVCSSFFFLQSTGGLRGGGFIEGKQIDRDMYMYAYVCI